MVSIKERKVPWSGPMDKLSQDDESMFERNIAIIASRRNEVVVYSGDFVFEGFLCGLDSKWLQIYGHEESEKGNSESEWRFVLLGRENISGVVPSGRGLYDIEETSREYISKKIKNFSDVADKFLSTRGYNDSRKEKH
jgi:hypothetical protein